LVKALGFEIEQRPVPLKKRKVLGGLSRAASELVGFVDGGGFEHKATMKNIGDETIVFGPAGDIAEIELRWEYPGHQSWNSTVVSESDLPRQLARDEFFLISKGEHPVLSPGVVVVSVQIGKIAAMPEVIVKDSKGQEAAYASSRTLKRTPGHLLIVKLDRSFAQFRVKARSEVYQIVLMTIAIAALTINTLALLLK
jgi:hypothetical protein